MGNGPTWCSVLRNEPAAPTRPYTQRVATAPIRCPPSAGMSPARGLRANHSPGGTGMRTSLWSVLAGAAILVSACAEPTRPGQTLRGRVDAVAPPTLVVAGV